MENDFLTQQWARGVAGAKGVYNRVSGGYLGRQVRLGVGDAFGFTANKMFSSNAVSGGFLDLAKNVDELHGAGKWAQVMSKDTKISDAAIKGILQGEGRVALAGKTLAAGAGLGFTLYGAYQGWKQDGLTGAMWGAAENVAWNVGSRLIGSALLNPYTLGAAAVAGAGYGAYRLGEAAQAHSKRLRNTEFVSTTMIDALGSAGAMTMRQRSVMALQNTHLNARMALGNEALLMRTSYNPYSY